MSARFGQADGVKRWSLKTLLFAQLILVALLPMAAVGLVLLAKAGPQLAEDVRLRQQSITRSMAGQIETHLASAERELGSLAAMVASEGAGFDATAGVDRLLDAVVRSGDLYEAIYLAGHDGMLRGLGLPASRRQARQDLRVADLSRRPFVTEALTRGEVVWSPAFLSAISGRLVVAVALPVKGGVLVGELALPQLSLFLRNLNVEAGTVLMVVDSVGHLIAHPTPGLVGQRISLSGFDLVRNAFTRGASFGEANLDGQPVIASGQTVARIRWVVLMAQPEAMAHRLNDVVQIVFLAGFLFALLLATGAAALVARSMAGKFGVFTRNAALVARGRHDLNWPPTRVSEFADLAGDLQETADEIRLREQDLRSGEQRLLATLENTPNVAIQWFDRDGRVVYWNRSSQTLYGLSKDQAIGQTLQDLIYTAEEAAAFREMLRGIAEDGLPVGPYEAAFRRPDGSPGVVLSTTFAIPGDETGGWYVCMDIDVTQQKRLTQALEQRERRFRALIEQSPMAVIEWDLDFQVSEWNQAAEKIFGYARADALGRHVRLIMPPERQPLVDQIWASLRANTGGERSENDNITADGRRITCQWYNRPLLDENGQIIAVVSMVEDVSERIRIDRALKASEQKFLALFHASPVAVAVARYGSTSPFADCNEAWQRQFGWQREEILGQSGLELGLWVEEGQQMALLDAMRREALVVDMEVSLRRRDGQPMTCLMSGRAIEIDGEKMIVFAYHDVTGERRIQQEISDLNASLEARVEKRTAALALANSELKTTLDTLQRAQRELVRSEKMAALGSLVAGIAHELNTPIGNSLMAVSTLEEHSHLFRETLRGGAVKRSTLNSYVEDAATASSIILRNLQKASELVTSFKQVAVDQTSAQRRRFTVHEVVAEIVLTLRPSFRCTPYQILTRVPEDITLDSYPGPLGQVLNNLINNALVHGFEGRAEGTVTILAERLNEREVRLQVSDDGVGVPPQYLGRVFDPFFTTRLGKGGSGLGLHIVHNIVTQVLGGRVGVDSSPAGSRFWIEIPLLAPENAAV